MKYLVLSDIHANAEALDAALTAAGTYDSLLVLGDLVGYGADPNRVIERLRALPVAAIIRGNHDKVAAGVEEGEHFSEIALAAALWTRGALTPANLGYLSSLPRGPLEVDGFLISHGTPLEEDAYLLSEEDARCVFDAMPFRLAFFGHSHFACTFHQGGAEVPTVELLAGDECVLPLSPGRRYLVNPGSIGQPRDGDWRGSAAVFDSDTRLLQYIRFEYDLHKAQEKIRRAGLPVFLADRLARGR